MLKKYDEWIPEYLAGHLNEEQVTEFEKALEESAELRSELNAAEIALENYTIATAKNIADADLQNQIWEKLQAEEVEADLLSENNDFTAGTTENTKQFSIGNFMNSYIGIAASVLLLMSLLGNIYFANQAKVQKNNFLSVLEEKSLLQEKLNRSSEEDNLFAQEVAMLKNPNMKVCKLVSNGQQQNNSLLLAIDMAKDRQVMVMSPDLPSKPNDHSYQLWAISESGETVCMGTFDSEKKIYKMKKLPFTPKEFGVTMELGELGMPQPTSDFLVRGI